jgi:hypothetical protein
MTSKMLILRSSWKLAGARPFHRDRRRRYRRRFSGLPIVSTITITRVYFHHQILPHLSGHILLCCLLNSVNAQIGPFDPLAIRSGIARLAGLCVVS